MSVLWPLPTYIYIYIYIQVHIPRQQCRSAQRWPNVGMSSRRWGNAAPTLTTIRAHTHTRVYIYTYTTSYTYTKSIDCSVIEMYNYLRCIITQPAVCSHWLRWWLGANPVTSHHKPSLVILSVIQNTKQYQTWNGEPGWKYDISTVMYTLVCNKLRKTWYIIKTTVSQ